MTIVCECCHRVTISGLTRTEEAIVSRLSAANRPMTAAELWKGLSTDVRSAPVLISKLREKLQPHGVTIPAGGNGRGHHALYSIATLDGGDA